MSDIAEAGKDLFTPDAVWISQGPQETHDLGKLLGEKLQAGDVVALSGELGAGKTCLTQGIAAGLGVPNEYPITSPTFTIINEYPGRVAMYHLDMYRLAGTGDLLEIGYESCFNEGGVVVIEWAEKVWETLPEGTLFVFITYLDVDKRRIVISRNRQYVDQLMKTADGGL